MSRATREREDQYFEAAIRRAIAELGDSPSMHQIRDAVVRSFGLSVDDITKISKWSFDQMARQAVMVLGSRLTKKSYSQVGAVIGGVDHTTIRNACRKFNSIVDKVLGPEKLITKPRRKTLADKAREIQLDTLMRLEKWSIEDTFSAPDDIFPEFSYGTRSRRLGGMHELGYAEREFYAGENYYRITPLGRERMKELLGGGMAAQTCPAVGDPDHRVGMVVRETLEEAA